MSTNDVYMGVTCLLYITHLAFKYRIPIQTCYAILHEIEARGDFQITWGLADDGYSDTVRISRTTTERKPKLGLVSTHNVPLKCFLEHSRKPFLGKLLTLC